ncbi:MAG: hypothetical protein IJY93_02555 [Clostridia bacterium]|nr:hypothetical protein [Clostridia bacterium]
MKRTLTLLLAAALMFSATVLSSCDDADDIIDPDDDVLENLVGDTDDDVYVTIAKGGIVLAYEDVDLRDADNDGTLTVSDALYLAHEEKYNGGASAGFASEMSDYGLSLTKLWGDESGSFGYTVNNVSCMSLADPVKAGDHIVAYVYTDTATWSDIYCYFDKAELDINENAQFTLALTMNTYDAEWNTVQIPVEGARITINGNTTDYVTDANGKVTLSLTDDAIISAVSDTMTLVPPICSVDVD